MSQVEQIGLCKLIWTNIYLPQVATSNMLNMSGPSFPRILQLAWSRDMETIISQWNQWSDQSDRRAKSIKFGSGAKGSHREGFNQEESFDIVDLSNQNHQKINPSSAQSTYTVVLMVKPSPNITVLSPKEAANPSFPSLEFDLFSQSSSPSFSSTSSPLSQPLPNLSFPSLFNKTYLWYVLKINKKHFTSYEPLDTPLHFLQPAKRSETSLTPTSELLLRLCNYNYVQKENA